jgi:hypothetical protein
VLVGLALVVLALGVLSLLVAAPVTDALDRLLGLRRLAQAAMAGHPLVHAALALQAVLIAIPFVPGAEIGFLLLALFGAPMAGQVYAATVAGLLIAFAVGRAVSRHRVRRLLDRCRLGEAAAALERLAQNAAEPAPGAALPGRLARRLLRHRCLCLVLLINTPGNSLLGGGGGIAMAAGLSGLFTARQFLASVLVAVAPVSAFVLLMAT